MSSASKIFNSLMDSLTTRQKEVLTGRFDMKEPQTLAALGKKYGVTRERIRQIETSGLNVLRKQIMANPVLLDVLERTKKYLRDSGGVVNKPDLVAFKQRLLDGITENQIALVLEAAKPFHLQSEDRDFHPFYYLEKGNFRTASTFVNGWVNFLKGRKDQVLEGKYDEHLKKFIARKGIQPAHAKNFLDVSKKIGANVFGDVGLTEWPEIYPRTIRDRVYLVLKKKTEPLHFKDIADQINQIGFDKRKASAPTVHNELIKDTRFVLVGRGIYGLSEHGYEPGTAREVIHRILKKRGALRPKEIMSALQKERFFKPNTILVNLQNKSYFERLPNGAYQVREV